MVDNLMRKKESAYSDSNMVAWLLRQPGRKTDMKNTPFSVPRWRKLAKDGIVEPIMEGKRLIGAKIKSTNSPYILSKKDSLLLQQSNLPCDNKVNVDNIYSISRTSQIVQHVTNQGRGATVKWKHLSFRSDHEVAIASKLDTIGVMFFPNAAVRVTENGKRVTKEVDFLVCKNGHWGILEVDGTQHRESRAEDMMRDDAFTDAGVWFIRRYPAAICKQKPEWVAQDFVTRLDTYYLRLK